MKIVIFGSCGEHWDKWGLSLSDGHARGLSPLAQSSEPDDDAIYPFI